MPFFIISSIESFAKVKALLQAGHSSAFRINASHMHLNDIVAVLNDISTLSEPHLPLYIDLQGCKMRISSTQPQATVDVGSAVPIVSDEAQGTPPTKTGVIVPENVFEIIAERFF